MKHIRDDNKGKFNVDKSIVNDVNLGITESSLWFEQMQFEIQPINQGRKFVKKKKISELYVQYNDMQSYNNTQLFMKIQIQGKCHF